MAPKKENTTDKAAAAQNSRAGGRTQRLKEKDARLQILIAKTQRTPKKLENSVKIRKKIEKTLAMLKTQEKEAETKHNANKRKLE